MNRSHLVKSFRRLVLGAACLASVSCGGDLLRTGRAPVYLTVVSLASAGGQVLRSDVVSATGLAVDDLVTATLRVDLKNPALALTTLNAITITRYHVEFRRSDGRNTPGEHVPYAFDGGAGVTINAGGTGTIQIQAVRQASKLDPPLRNLVSGGGAMVISTIATITFYGRDQNGNEVSANANMDVTFGDF